MMLGAVRLKPVISIDVRDQIPGTVREKVRIIACDRLAVIIWEDGNI